MEDITVTWKEGRDGSVLALVRYKAQGEPPRFRAIEVPGDIIDHWDMVMAFALGRAEFPAEVQGWLWEA